MTADHRQTEKLQAAGAPVSGCSTQALTTAQALAASKPDGLQLMVGPVSADLTGALMTGLQPGAKLIAVHEEPFTPDLRGAMMADIRVACHCQSLPQFLTDIAHHRFDLIAVTMPLPDAVSAQMLTLLNPGGFLLTTGSEEPATDLSLFSPVPVLRSDDLCAWAMGAPVLRRRGGRSSTRRAAWTSTPA